MPPSESPPPDVVIGRHPDYGIVAANPKNLAASAWMLRGFGFHPVPDHLGLYALADQPRDGRERATRAVDLLRRANYQVEADVEFDSLLTAPEPSVSLPHSVEPDVAFAEHPQLGVVAATGHSTVLGGQLLAENGWRHHARLDIYTLPATTGRDQALGKVAQASAAMQDAGLRIAVQPTLARDIAARRPSAPNGLVARDRSSDTAARTFPAMNAAALAPSPARTGRPGTPPVSAPVPVPRPADPPAESSRTR
ncbi:hypothetical protein [Streptomyces sp. NPDC021020]|uniref:hypothetical protein n=1 Tax=Streptomyces sp. NPDC021020 TaxID=3365109 RepID=UPI0037925A5F